MSVNLRVLVPEGTTNYITNPSIRYDTSGYTAWGSSISRSTDQARFNVASLKVDTNGSALYEGAYFRVSALSGISEPITASVYVRGSGIVRLRLINNPAGKEWFSQPVHLGDRWARLSISGYSTGSDDLRIYVETDVRTQDTVFYVDGVQLERKDHPTTFCDGDQEGCRWNGLYHSSTSTRTPYTRAGGRWVDLAGPCRQDDNIYATVLAGMGISPHTIQQQSWSLEPGSFFQNTKIRDRIIAITFHAKNASGRKNQRSDLSSLLSLRQQLIDIFKPDRTHGSEPFLIEYGNGDKSLYFWARYSTGLEGDWDIRNGKVDSFGIAFLCNDPLMFEDDYQVQSLDFQEWIQKAGKSAVLLARIDGVWRSISEDGTGFDTANYVNRLAVAPDGTIYASGTNVFRIDGTKLTRIGTNVVNSFGSPRWISDIAVGLDGKVYVCGGFNSISGVVTGNVAVWDGSSWSDLAGGLGEVSSTDHVYRVIVAQNGDVYFGGFFNVSAFETNVIRPKLARWDGSSWRQPYIGTLDNHIYTLAPGVDRTSIIVLGNFSTDGIQSLPRAASLDIATMTFSPLGGGFNAIPYAVVVAKDGTIFAVGSFYMDKLLTKELKQVAFYNGQEWYELGDGLGQSGVTTISARALAIDPSNGDIYIGGWFASVGNVPVECIARWHGDRRSEGRFTRVDISIPFNINSGLTSMTFQDILITPKGDIYVAGSTGFTVSATGAGAAWAKIPGRNTVNNNGTANVTPRFYVRGPLTLKSIENQTAHQNMWFDLDIAQDEEVIIDCGKSSVISNIRGSIPASVIPVESLAEFKLLPGDNTICVLATDDNNSIVQIGFTPVHLSADAVTNVEALA